MPRASRSDPPVAARARPKRHKPTRAEKVELVKRALFKSAARVVGKYGYADASVSRITAGAKVAQGTFYNHFASRQELLDQLLPAVGEDMLEYIRARVDRNANELEQEAQRFDAFFGFMVHNPDFFRILNEAEQFAPKAFYKHIENQADSYLRALTRARGNDALAERFTNQEIEVLVYILIGIRSYIGIHYVREGSKVGPLPKHVTRTYLKLLRRGLFKNDDQT